MAYKILVLAMLVTLHATAVLFASLATYRWLVDADVAKRDVGVFGVCEHLNKSTVVGLIRDEMGSEGRGGQDVLPLPPLLSSAAQKSRNNSAASKSGMLDDEETFIVDEEDETEVKSKRPDPTAIGASIQFRASLPSVVRDNHEKSSKALAHLDRNHFRSMSDLMFLDEPGAENGVFYRKCYQVLWPTRSEAFKYLATKSLYLTVMMGVAICSASLGILTLFWSFMCILFTSVGMNLRASELLIILSILTDISIVSTLALFIGKDERIYPFRFYGFSFWLSVGAACGFFLSSILFTINRINIRYKYIMRNYQKKLTEVY